MEVAAEAYPISRIRVLDAAVIDHIAAGEVVERPASVVKELVENAFDAGANTVQVDLERGGLDAITVTDDGQGMAPADARLCVLRHATSKLRGSEDLFCIRTLGFRGEALSSIASVSHLIITTRPKDARTGLRLEIRGGQVLSEQEVGCPRGTSVAVRELFYNTPARRKFMRAPATEQAHVVDTALRVGLARRHGGLLVMSGARRLVDIPDDAAGHARVVAALGPRVRDLAALGASQDGVRVDGFVSKPGLDRTDSKGLWLFVNGRFVRDRMLQRALCESHPQTVPGRHPTAIVHIDMDPEAVDVNVHPQKLEVRFADATTVFRALSTALHNVAPMAAQDSAPAQAPGTLLERYANRAWSLPKRHDVEQTQAVNPARVLGAGGPADGETAHVDVAPALQVQRAPAPKHEVAPSTIGGTGPAPAGYFQRLVPWGAIQPYWLVADRRGALLLDARRAAVWLARAVVRMQFADGNIVVHNLLFPLRLDIPRALFLLLQERCESLAPLGFEVELAGPETFVLRAVPDALMHAEPQALVQACLRALWTDGTPEEITPQRALQALERCAEQVEAPKGRADFDALLRALDAHSVRPTHPDAPAWLRRIDAVDVQRLFDSLRTVP